MGPEAVIEAVASRRARGICRPLLVGEPSVWKRAGWRSSLASLADTGLGFKAPPPGKPTPRSGMASYAAVRLAADLAARGVVAGIVTAPISKRAWSLAGVPFGDHTDYFSRRCGSAADMVLGAPAMSLWCVPATRHLPLRSAIASLSAGRIVAAAASLHAALRLLGYRRPRLVLCGLNPHAGEEGLLGGEERRILAPASRLARGRGIALEGPLAADSAWRLHRAGVFDGVVALYHDQALIPLKMAAGLGVVNWTVGLSGLVRTSPGHGTAFDIAGRGRADQAATIAAAELAARLVR